MTLREAYAQVKTALCQSDIAEAAFEANQLLCYVTGFSKEQILLNPQAELSVVAQTELKALTDRRTNHEPLQYLLGSWEFYGRTFAVGEGVLIPRQDTETLCEAAIARLKGRNCQPQIMDLCAGSGCIAITLAKELALQHPIVFAMEKSDLAFTYLEKNIKNHDAKVTPIKGDVLVEDHLAPNGFDVIISNPPYLTTEDMLALQPEVKHEPRMALQAGEDGLRFYRGITAVWKHKLKPGGVLLFEVGAGQHESVKQIMQANGMKNVCFIEDICGIMRVVCAIK